MKRPSGILGEIELGKAHGKWLEWDGKGAQEPPSYKDCDRCDLPDETESEEDRRELCAACPWEAATDWDELPAGPSEHYLSIVELALLPESCIDEAIRAREMNYSEVRDVTLFKRKVFSFG